MHGMHEVVGSIPIRSTKPSAKPFFHLTAEPTVLFLRVKRAGFDPDQVQDTKKKKPPHRCGGFSLVVLSD